MAICLDLRNLQMLDKRKGEFVRTKRWLRCTFLSIIVGFAVEVNSQTNTVTPRVETERVDATVIKVYSARDGDARFRAYAVKWKDQEIVMVDPLSNTLYKEGDTISVYVHRETNPAGQLLRFSMNPWRTPFRRSDG
jgi:hypothetical protein